LEASVKANRGKLCGGVDVNVDRISLAIIDSSGELRDVYAFWFRETTARGFQGRVLEVL
jgi:hypothetical protein